MQNFSISKVMALMSALLFVAPAYANYIWSVSLLVSTSLYSTLFVVIGTIAIEAFFFRRYLPQISWLKATFMSIVGNIASSIIGTFIMMIVTHVAVLKFVNTFISSSPLHPEYSDPVGLTVLALTIPLMCLGSILTELATLCIFFRYPARQMLKAVIIGNIVTYILTTSYMLWQFRDIVFSSAHDKGDLIERKIIDIARNSPTGKAFLSFMEWIFNFLFG